MRSPMDLEYDLKWVDDLDAKDKKTFSEYLSDDRRNTRPVVVDRSDEGVRDLNHSAAGDTNAEHQSDFSKRSSERVSLGASFLINFPFICISYLHLAFNIVAVSVAVYGLVSFVFLLRKDFSAKLNRSMVRIDKIAEEGRINYIINGCLAGVTIPALAGKCIEWKAMMDRKFGYVNRTRIMMETLGETIDGFTSNFSFKSYAMIVLLFAIYLLFRDNKFNRR